MPWKLQKAAIRKLVVILSKDLKTTKNYVIRKKPIKWLSFC